MTNPTPLSPAAQSVLDAVALSMEGGWISPEFVPYEARKIAATLLQQQAAPSPAVAPVAVSERLPGPEDCDEQGRCWWYGEGADMFGWTLDAEGASYYRSKFWLPANALPTPEAQP